MPESKPPYPQKYLPTMKGIVTLTFSAILFGALAGRLFFSTRIDSDLLDVMAVYGMAIFFSFFFFASLFYLLTIKIVYLSKDNGLTIRYPLLFQRIEVDLKTLRNSKEQPFLIKHKRDFEKNADIIYSGKRLTIFLNNKKSIELNSFMTKDFYTLKDFIAKLS